MWKSCKDDAQSRPPDGLLVERDGFRKADEGRVLGSGAGSGTRSAHVLLGAVLQSGRMVDGQWEKEKEGKSCDMRVATMMDRAGRWMLKEVEAERALGPWSASEGTWSRCTARTGAFGCCYTAGDRVHCSGASTAVRDSAWRRRRRRRLFGTTAPDCICKHDREHRPRNKRLRLSHSMATTSTAATAEGNEDP